MFPGGEKNSIISIPDNVMETTIIGLLPDT